MQPLAVAKIDDAIEEHLNGRDLRHPPPEFPATSQIEGELRELRVRSQRRAIACSTNVLGEELLVCFQRTVDGEVEREFAAVA